MRRFHQLRVVQHGPKAYYIGNGDRAIVDGDKIVARWPDDGREEEITVSTEPHAVSGGVQLYLNVVDTAAPGAMRRIKPPKGVGMLYAWPEAAVQAVTPPAAPGERVAFEVTEAMIREFLRARGVAGFPAADSDVLLIVSGDPDDATEDAEYVDTGMILGHEDGPRIFAAWTAPAPAVAAAPAPAAEAPTEVTLTADLPPAQGEAEEEAPSSGDETIDLPPVQS